MQKIVTLIVLFVALHQLLFSYTRNKSGIEVTSMNDSVIVCPDLSVLISLPQGWHVQKASSDRLNVDIANNKNETISIYVAEADAYFMGEAIKHDSTNIFKGFAIAKTLAVVFELEANNYANVRRIDSIVEFRNKSGLRCLRIRATASIFDLDQQPDDKSLLPCEDYYVDISQGNKLRILEVSCGLDNSGLREIYNDIVQKINFISRNH